MSPWSLHQDAAKRATSYFKQTGPTLPAEALAAAFGVEVESAGRTALEGVA